MSTKLTTAAVLLSGLMFTGASEAAEVSLESFVGSLVSQAASATKQELTNNVQEAVLTANHLISFDTEKVYATKVTITDINDVVKTESKDDKAE